MQKRTCFLEDFVPAGRNEFFKETCPFLHGAWISSLLDPQIPRLQNTDGEDLPITRVRFEIADPAAPEEALDKANELDREQLRSHRAAGRRDAAMKDDVSTLSKASKVALWQLNSATAHRKERKCGVTGNQGPHSRREVPIWEICLGRNQPHFRSWFAPKPLLVWPPSTLLIMKSRVGGA